MEGSALRADADFDPYTTRYRLGEQPEDLEVLCKTCHHLAHARGLNDDAADSTGKV